MIGGRRKTKRQTAVRASRRSSRTGDAVSPSPRRRIAGLGKFYSGIADLGNNKKHLGDFGLDRSR